MEIDRIVREVLAEMGLLPQAPGEEAADGDPAISEAPQSLPAPPTLPVARAGDVFVGERVVTMAAVGERLAAARRLVVPPRAVVTPAVRDELRRRRILLVFEESRPVKSAAAGRAAVAVLGSRIDPAPIVEELKRAGIAVDLERFDCLIEATDALAGRLAGRETAGVLLSNHGAIALCLANRHAGVRAILSTDESRTAADTASVGANLLVVEPRRTPPAAMRQMIASFCRSGPGECPAALQARLS